MLSKLIKIKNILNQLSLIGQKEHQRREEALKLITESISSIRDNRIVDDQLRPINTINSGCTVFVAPGDHFHLILPDGTRLSVEQTADDFSITRMFGTVGYTKNTSGLDGYIEPTTGRG
jgi:hypothetical protein